MYPDKELVFGDNFAVVGDLQRRLRDAKLLDLSLVQVGSFCELTKSAVEELQRRRGLLVSGV
ncbi:MAG: hypothetical protein F2939_00465, partial [Actinobacteria bacterium]|nr:hypothetical protein [Actinomycetota bacterium]